MIRRCMTRVGMLATVVAVGAFASIPLAGQTQRAGAKSTEAAKPTIEAKTWTVSKTPDGQPDLQGMWLNFDSTPFERPTTAPRPVAEPNAPREISGFDEGLVSAPRSARRGSLVVDPPDGKVPVMPWAEAKRDDNLAHLGDSWEHHGPWERCITRSVPGGIFPTGYDSAYQILQGPGYVAIVYEMIHETRIIPVDGSPHLPQNIRLWNGDSRGHWEGNTLVVDITNYNDKGSIATNAATGRIKGIPQSEALHVIERFTPIDANTINYEVSVTDPKVYTRPWKVAIPLNRDESYRMYEYACHEGNENYMKGSLGGGRAKDKAAEEAAKEGSK
jgi:hypothetical protein